MSAAAAPVDLTAVLPAVRTLTAADLDGLVEELAAYHAHFAPLFRRPEQRAWAAVYLRGLLTADVPRKNVEALALRLLGAGPGADRQVRAMQQFVGAGGWDDAGLLAAHRRERALRRAGPGRLGRDGAGGLHRPRARAGGFIRQTGARQALSCARARRATRLPVS